LRWLVSSFVRICPFYLDCQIFLDGLEHTAGPRSESFTLHFGSTQHISLYTLHSEVVTTDSTAPGYGRFSDSLLQRQRFIKCASDRLCNTRGVCHQLSSGFELKHGRLSGDEDVKVKPIETSPNLNLDIAPLLAQRPFFKIYAWVELLQYLHVSHLSTYLY
jgi:hypothetical protein